MTETDKANGMKMKKTGLNGRRKRASKGAGRLYKRDAAGKEHPAEWQGSGAYWLAYSIPNTDGGVGQRVRMPLRDDQGNPVTDREQAEAERKRIMAPYQTGDHAETLRALQARIQDANAAHVQAVDEATPPLRIKDVWQAYLVAPERPDSGPLTLEQYEGHWKRFEKWISAAHSGVEYLRDVTGAIAAEYAGDLSKAKLSGNRFNKHISFLRLCFRALGDIARITINPFEKIKRKNQRPHSRRELTIPELTDILAHADGDLALLLYLGATTGLRLGDCCTLTWGEVDLVRGIIRRIPNKTAKNGKPVVVGIPSALHRLLDGRHGRRRTGYVLPALAEQYRRDPTIITNAVKDHVLNCGIDVHSPLTGSRIKRKADGTPERDNDNNIIIESTGKPAVVDVGFHSLRHTWVSMHAAVGTPGAVIQATVGHANPAMTAHYTHVSEITARDVAKALPAFAGNLTHLEPPPAWVVEIIKTLTPENAISIKTQLLAKVHQ